MLIRQVPQNYFSSTPGLFGTKLRLFGPDLKNDLKQIRSILEEDLKQVGRRRYNFYKIDTATKELEKLMPNIGKRRIHDLSIALYWELHDDAIRMPDDYLSYERVKGFLQSNEYGL